MTEYGKMVRGELYNALDPELCRRRQEARGWLEKLNASLHDTRAPHRRQLCEQLFGSIGPDVLIQPPFYCDYGRHISLGRNIFINFNCVFLDVAKIVVGDSVQIGPNVQLYTAGHPLEWQKRRDGQEFGKPIVIEHDVWIGGGAIICPGVTIGAKSVIGAGSVVTKDVPSGVVAAGNPSKILKELSQHE